MGVVRVISGSGLGLVMTAERNVCAIVANPLKNTSNAKMELKFTLKEIAHQAGLSLATVDRVVHERAHVRALTRARVQAAQDELHRQHAASLLGEKRVTLDIVMQAPERFSTTIVWPIAGVTRSASSRARMSVEPPGGYGTTIRIGRDG